MKKNEVITVVLIFTALQSLAAAALVEVSVKTDKFSYFLNETPTILVKAYNPNDYQVKLEYGSSCQADHLIDNTYQWSHGLYFTQALTEVFIEPHSFYTWSQYHYSAQTLGIGTHTVIGWTNGFYSNPVTFEVVPELSDRKFGTLGGQNNRNLTMNDSYDTPITFSLTGGGWGEVSDDANQITIHDTTEKSLLTISTPKGKTAYINSITVNSSIKGIMANSANLVRGSITVAGSLGTLTLKAAELSQISIGQSLNPKTSVAITFGQADKLNVDSSIPIKSIKGQVWKNSSIHAPSIGSIKIAEYLSCSCECDSIKNMAAKVIEDTDFLLNKPPDTDGRTLTLGFLTAKSFCGSQILSKGHIGKVIIGGMENSICFAGVEAAEDSGSDSVLGLPNPDTDISYTLPATIRSIKIKGIKVSDGFGSYIYGMTDSNIAAANILSASIVNPEFYGSNSFGIAADSIKSLKIKGDNWSYSGQLNDPGNVPTVPGNFKINIK